MSTSAVTDTKTGRRSRPPRVKTRQERQAETRQSLIDAAKVVVARRGIEGASHREIAAEAGVTIGAIYANFTNKADLIVSLLEDASRDSTMLDPDSASIGECLKDLGRRLVEQADTHPELTVLSMEFALAEVRDPDIRERRLPRRRAEHTEYARAIEQIAARSGEKLPMPAEQFVEVVANLGWSLLCSRAMVGPDVITDDFIVQALALLGPGA